jgi:hypothetical protein
MICAVSANSAVVSVATSHTTFTKLASAQATNDTTATAEVWYGYAASGDPGAVCTITITSSNYPCTAFAAYSNAAVSSPIDSFATDHTTSASDVTTIPCTGSTTVSANVLPVSVLGGGGSSATPTLTAPTGYTIRSTGGGGDFEAVSIADAAVISASGTSYGTGSWTYGGGGGGATVTFAIKAAPTPITSSGSIAAASYVLNTISGTGSIAASPMGLSGLAANPLVQSTSGSSTTTSLTLTFTNNITYGNAVILGIAGFFGGTVSTITLGGTGNLFNSVSVPGNTDNNAQIWFAVPVTIASGTIVITTSVAGIIAYAYEVSGAAPYYGVPTGMECVWNDQSEWGYSTSASWSSSTTGSTIPAMEFVVGIGATTGTASITVTGPGTGGWSNQTAVNGTHAGTHFYSAISGSQVQQSASSTYTYSGTSSASSTWGSSVATFLLMPMYDNWSGYEFSEHSSYTAVSATFTIPALTGQAGSVGSIWVGLGNINQCGITFAYDTGYTSNVWATAWSEWVPGGNQNWDATAYPTKAGDSVTASVQITSTAWVMTIVNHTESWTYAETKSVLATNIGELLSAPSGPAQFPYPLSSAAVIVEDEGDEITGGSTPNYGSIAFTSVTTTPAIYQPPMPIATENTDIDQYPGPFNLSNGSFTVYWNDYT